MDLLDILLRTWVNARENQGGLKVLPHSLPLALEAAGLIAHSKETDRWDTTALGSARLARPHNIIVPEVAESVQVSARDYLKFGPMFLRMSMWIDAAHTHLKAYEDRAQGKTIDTEEDWQAAAADSRAELFAACPLKVGV